jgi:lysophospholipase L1-like esterase
MGNLNNSGWLPYGSSDASIILQHPLTSDPTTYLQSLGTLTTSGASTYNPVMGMKTNGTGTLRLDGLANRANLDWGFQVTYEVETPWITANIPSIASSGYIPPTATAQCPLSGYTPALLGFGSWHKAQDTSSYGIVLGVTSGSGFYANSHGKNSFTRVCVGFRGGKQGGVVTYGLDDTVYFEKTANAATMSDLLSIIWIGSTRVIANTFCDGYIRNLQISTRSPSFPVHPQLRSIGILSDSLFATDVLINTYGDAVTSWAMRREFATRGLYPGTVTLNSLGGACYSSAGATYLGTNLTTVLATNPSVLVLRGGTNDASQSFTDDADWETQVTAYITAAFANPYVRMIVMPNIPYLIGDATKAYSEPLVRLGNERLLNVAATWRAANPSDPRKIIVPDVNAALGGLSPPSGTYIGQVNGLWNDLHLSSGGHALHGRRIAQAIMAELGNLS